MPVTKSTEYAKFDNIGMNQRPDSIQAEGRIRYLNDVITLVGDETTGVTSAGTKVFNANATALVESSGALLLTFKSGTAAASTLRVSVAYYVR